MPPQPAGVAAAFRRSALARQRGTLHVICDAVIRALRQHDEDDTTLVLARIPGRRVQAPGQA